jgi:hypothetical protein
MSADIVNGLYLIISPENMLAYYCKHCFLKLARQFRDFCELNSRPRTVRNFVITEKRDNHFKELDIRRLLKLHAIPQILLYLQQFHKEQFLETPANAQASASKGSAFLPISEKVRHDSQDQLS